MEIFERTELLLGCERVKELNKKSVIIFGVGGVGGYVCEALARSGVGAITLVDGDVVSTSNINRQIIALTSTVGKPKVQVMRDRILDINPHCKVTIYNKFFDEKSKDEISLDGIDYVVDCIDRVTNKISLIEWAKDKDVKIISAMGAGNKLDPTRFEVGNIYDTSVCPLCKVMRKELSKRNIKDLKVVYSKEQPKKISAEYDGKAICGSIAFVPPVVGLIMASEIIKDL